ncbi:hypothetical protein GCK72_005711 [Caenorhabditis remanei]|nr:hypothetical protein GCK72_005711 [Caenorhabditis remanei]KAF1765758.1 hypothetical protein GCK72_005711 [Caenorhabditis remanei]
MSCEEPTTSPTPENNITVVSSDGKEFLLDLKLTEQSETLARLISNFEYDRTDVKKDPVPLGNITSAQMQKIIEWLQHHRYYPKWEQNDIHYSTSFTFETWVEEYLNIPNNEMFELLNAANYLNIPRLFSTICRIMASRITGKSAEQIRTVLNIKTDVKNDVYTGIPIQEDSSSSEDGMSEISLSPSPPPI